MANNTWKNYTQKSTALSDNDEVMLLDSTDEKNKRGLMSKFWDYVVDKMSTAVISKLETDNKTIIGAINVLNSESGIMKVTFSDTDLNQLYEIGSSNTKIYVCVPGTPNIPEEYTGFVIVIRYDNNAKAQLYISLNGKLYFRINTASWNKVESIVL